MDPEPDPDVGWVMKQNLAKRRMPKVGADWVAAMTAELGEPHRTH